MNLFFFGAEAVFFIVMAMVVCFIFIVFVASRLQGTRRRRRMDAPSFMMDPLDREYRGPDRDDNQTHHHHHADAGHHHNNPLMDQASQHHQHHHHDMTPPPAPSFDAGSHHHSGGGGHHHH